MSATFSENAVGSVPHLTTERLADIDRARRSFVCAEVCKSIN
jgi:hypothetical protein